MTDDIRRPGRPRPHPTPTSAPYWEGLARGEVLLQHCHDCGAWIHYARHRCPACLSDRLSWRPSTGRGTVYTFTVAPVATAPEFAEDVPQLIAVVALAEGPRLTTTLIDVDPDTVRVGLPVVPVFNRIDPEITLLRYRAD